MSPLFGSLVKSQLLLASIVINCQMSGVFKSPISKLTPRGSVIYLPEGFPQGPLGFRWKIWSQGWVFGTFSQGNRRHTTLSNNLHVYSRPRIQSRVVLMLRLYVHFQYIKLPICTNLSGFPSRRPPRFSAIALHWSSWNSRYFLHSSSLYQPLLRLLSPRLH